jgi:hypothetical protein
LETTVVSELVDFIDDLQIYAKRMHYYYQNFQTTTSIKQKENCPRKLSEGPSDLLLVLFLKRVQVSYLSPNYMKVDETYLVQRLVAAAALGAAAPTAQSTPKHFQKLQKL